jgi:DNA invertase Pin-like site-specific DNA recombinase
MSMARRAVGIVRVSEVGKRQGESFASPTTQLERIQDACERDGLRLIQTFEELDISGGKSLADRPGLSLAVKAVEDGQADVVVAAYFDRLFRSLTTQAEVIERVEAAGGQVFAVDVGQVSNGTTGQWLSGTMHGMMAEYYRRNAKDRSAPGQARAIARGVVIGATPPGYLRGDDKRFVIDAALAPVVRQAFTLRDEGATLAAVRAFLLEHGIRRTVSGVRKMLKSRLYLGEARFGELVNARAHEALIDPDLFARVGRASVSAGRKAKSERLLARLRVLRCGACDGRMSAATTGGYPFYRCASQACSDPVCIGAAIAEEVVSSAVRTALQDAQGRASMAESATEAAGALERAQADVDAILRVLAATGAENEMAAIERLTESRRNRDEAQAHLDQIEPAAARMISADVDWDDLSLAGRRELIRATVESAIVAPGGRGAERITVRLYS